ncbi:hypothetical protein P7K49_028892 [Saguinus oedipus]|uniref:Uncharacterized protein n=1 Tax=Saguinus oedipus TaxID=9490 RepID=A0ABQ9U6F9_SAGOE|nr:hypothetical protein P7K49_028892 [Saguinus oedipus]
MFPRCIAKAVQDHRTSEGPAGPSVQDYMLTVTGCSIEACRAHRKQVDEGERRQDPAGAPALPAVVKTHKPYCSSFSIHLFTTLGEEARSYGSY